MQFLIGNPLGWLALTALGGVLLIHLLQQQARRVEISTLFPGYNGFCGSCSTPFIEPETSKFSSQLSA